MDDGKVIHIKFKDKDIENAYRKESDPRSLEEICRIYGVFYLSWITINAEGVKTNNLFCLTPSKDYFRLWCNSKDR
jgi:hypothetical protein